ncbi:Fe-S cluster assembly protein SufD [Oleiagrimonas citrea]|uniref:Fe-S cluster assembly protein SufD n=1 Tax=Oleiagrimonas citrea TaxID=1665687 RepID=A0A846ZJX1_9GAMM|nr:Fe-S cluster assembly protein SufD [Oleiagrimonas citrea]NKZ38007.1 Fe-S cluster assembly protein SufD [Oleiagrimonas citrea]
MASPFVEAQAERAPDVLARLPGAGLPWLDALRREQLEAFVREGLPGARNEAWKYTALRALERRAFLTGDAEAAARAVDISDFVLPGVDGPRLVFVHGVFRADLSSLDALPEGLRLHPLSQALVEDAEPLRFFLSRGGEQAADAFTRLNAALAGDGMVLRVAQGARIDAPVHLVQIGTPADEDLAWHARNIVELGEDASLTLIEHHVGTGPHKHLGTQVSDIVLHARAKLAWIGLQEAADGALLMRRDRVRLDANAHARVHAMELGGSLVRRELDAELRGEGARLDTRGVFLPGGRQHLDTRLDIRHVAKHTATDALWRGVADQRGRGVFHGAITVAEGADGADAALSNKNLLLSPHAEIDTQPVLEIYADEVMAAHGATVGQLDERALFYLRSRGLPAVAARTLLTLAFCRAALDDLDHEALCEHLGERLAERLPGGETAA